MGMGWIGPNRYDYTRFDREVDVILRGDPKAYVFPRLAVSPPDWWYELHPEEMNVYEDGTRMGVCMASELWLREAGEAFTKLMEHVKEAPYNDHFIGYQVTGGINEWFYWGWGGLESGQSDVTRKFPDYSSRMLDGFRRWLEQKYDGDAEALQGSWKKAKVEFETATIPSKEERLSTDLNLFRDPSVSRRVSDYYEFFSEVDADAVIHFCKLGKNATRGEGKILGAFYGYLMNAAGHPYCQQHWGHQALKKVLDTPEVEFLCAPYQYINRGPGGVDGQQAPISSIMLSGKLWLTEVDGATHLAKGPYVPEGPGTPSTIEETVGILKRDFSNVLTRGVGMWWMDLEVAGGWYSDPRILECISKLREIAEQSLSLDRTYRGGVALIIDSETPYYLKPGIELSYSLSFMQTVLGYSRMGTPYDIYLHDDLANPEMPEYQLYIFVNTFYLTESEREAIKRRIRREGKTALWMYAPGFIGEKGLSVESMYDLTGIHTKYRKLEHDPHRRGAPLYMYITDYKHPITRGIPLNTVWGTDSPIGPMFYCDDPEATHLGNIMPPQMGEKHGFCLKEFEHWRSIFIGAPNVPSWVLRNICKYAGVHVYSDYDDVVYASDRFLAIHTKHGARRTVRLPRRTNVYDLFKEEYVARDATEFEDYLPQYATGLYFLGDIEELRR